jgi:hypothetical protein
MASGPSAALDNGVRSSREAITMPTTSELTAMSKP